MDDLMARTMVENLSLGIHPITGKRLSYSDSCSNEVVQEAIKTVLENCTIDSYATILKREREKKKKHYIIKQKDPYPRSQIPWTKAEDEKVRVLFKKGYPVSQIAAIMKRDPARIVGRLEGFGFRDFVANDPTE